MGAFLQGGPRRQGRLRLQHRSQSRWQIYAVCCDRSRCNPVLRRRKDLHPREHLRPDEALSGSARRRDRSATLWELNAAVTETPLPAVVDTAAPKFVHEVVEIRPLRGRISAWPQARMLAA